MEEGLDTATTKSQLSGPSAHSLKADYSLPHFSALIAQVTMKMKPSVFPASPAGCPGAGPGFCNVLKEDLAPNTSPITSCLHKLRRDIRLISVSFFFSKMGINRNLREWL